jgi:hypothetical protein
MEIKVYDKAAWYTEKYDSKKVVRFFSKLMDFLKNKGYLNTYGLEIYGLKDDPALSITSEMLTDKGNMVLSSAYDRFLAGIDFESEPDFTILCG